MPISEYLRAKWEGRLANWAEWHYGGAIGSEGVSSAYDGMRSGYREPTSVVLSGEAQDTDRLLKKVRLYNSLLYDALDQWAQDRGERHAQAARLGIHPDTYRDRVDSGMRKLEDFSIGGRKPEIKDRPNAPSARARIVGRRYDDTDVD